MVRTRAMIGKDDAPPPPQRAPARGRGKAGPRERSRGGAARPAAQPETAPIDLSLPQQPAQVQLSVIKDVLLQMLSMCGGVPSGEAQTAAAQGAQAPPAQSIPEVPLVQPIPVASQAQPVPEAPLVQPFPAAAPVQIQPAPATPQPIVARPVMTPEELKMLDFFLRLAPRFSGAPGQDPHMFLVSCEEMLHNLGLVDTRGVDFTVFQLEGPAKQWWRFYQSSRPAGSPQLTWDQFSEAFMAKYLPRSMRERLRDQFISLKQGSMSVTQYEARFIELSRHGAMLMPTEEEWVRHFRRGLRLQLRMDTEVMVAMGKSFLEVVDYARTMERLHCEAQGGSNKRQCQHGRFSGIRSAGKGFVRRGPLYQQQQHHDQSSNSFQASLYTTDKGQSSQSSQPVRGSQLKFQGHGGHNGATGNYFRGRYTEGCFECGDLGHYVRDCPRHGAIQPTTVAAPPHKTDRGGASRSDVCRVCGGFGHWARECPSRVRFGQLGQQIFPEVSTPPSRDGVQNVEGGPQGFPEES